MTTTTAIDFRRIYREDADAYQRLVAAEDIDGALPRALASLAPLEGARVLDVGAGTGRLSALALDAGASHVLAVEPASAMADVARRHLAARTDASATGTWQVIERALPDLDGVEGEFDWVVAGWVVGHFCAWHGDEWPDVVDRSLARMRSLLADGGVLAIVETLGTGTTVAAPPTDALAALHQHLERQHGLERVVLRTDYGFGSPDEACATLGFFFGDELEATIRQHGWRRVPERTALFYGR